MSCGAWAYDEDIWVDDAEPNPVTAIPPDDIVSYLWVATAGTFPYGNTGQFVTWKAPSEPGTVVIACIADDAGGVPPGDNGTTDDSPGTGTVTVAVLGVSSISLDKQEIMSGAVPDQNHQCIVTATLSRPVSGVSVTFTLTDPSPATIPAALSATTAVTGSDGTCHVTLTSSNTPDGGYSVTVKAKVSGGNGSDEKSIQCLLLIPENEFYDPEE